MNIILFGFKGSGKSYLGKQLAQELGKAFIDTDDLFDQKIYRELGEAAFREKEREVIAQLEARDAVIALGGGTILCPKNRVLLSKMGTLVYLDVDKETLKKRVGEIYIDRPFEEVYEERLPLYESVIAKRASSLKQLKEIVYGK